MLRNSGRISALLLKRARRDASTGRNQRPMSTYGERSGGGGRVLVTVGAVTLATLGGGIGYASYDPSFRTAVENNIPYANVVFETILGPPVDDIIDIPKPVSHPKIEKTPKEKIAEAGLIKKKAEREAAKPTAEAPVIAPTKKEVHSQKDLEPKVTTPEKKGPSPLEIYELKLKELEKSATSAATSAFASYEEAIRLTKEHSQKVLTALDNLTTAEADALWATVASAADLKLNAVGIAQKKAEEAKKYIEQLQNSLKTGLADPSIAVCLEIPKADDLVLKSLQQMDELKSKLSNAVLENEFMQKYQKNVRKWMKDLEKEIRLIKPDINFGGEGSLTENEVQLLLAHAHQKVTHLMQEVSRLQVLAHQSPIPEGIDTQHMVSDVRLQAELDRLRRDLNQENEKKLESQREEMDNLIRKQLRHQAAAHADHLQDVLRVQALELERRWTALLEDEVRVERQNYHQTLATLLGRVRGLDKAIKDRAELDDAWRRSQRLWAACSSLLLKLKTGQTSGPCWEGMRKSLQDEVRAVSEAAGPANVYVTTVMNAIPGDAAKKGVYPEDALKERFVKVERVCRRVALVGEEGGGLLRHLLSYFQSFLVVQSAFERLPICECRDEPIDVDQLNTFDILNRARYCLDKDDLAQAVRYMNLLCGAPRLVARDWLREARLLLETKQAAEALVAHAAAVGVQAAL